MMPCMNEHYYLIPRSSDGQPLQPVNQCHQTMNQSHQSHQCNIQNISPNVANRGCNTLAGNKFESSCQVNDGRYASSYRTAHCNLVPTSPELEITEFPPQRREALPGHGIFVIGGNGTGNTDHEPLKCSVSKGGLNWFDRGAVYRPRLPPLPNSFESSLRQYSYMTPQKSAEIVQKVLGYSQSKQSSKLNTKGSFIQRSNCDPYSDGVRQRQSLSYVDVDMNKNSKRDSPRSKWSVRKDPYEFVKSDVYRNVAPDLSGREMPVRSHHDIEIQAAALKISRDIETVPTVPLPSRTVAVNVDAKLNKESSPCAGASAPLNIYFQSVQTINSLLDIKRRHSFIALRRSKSHNFTPTTPSAENITEEILHLLTEISEAPSKDDTEKAFKVELLKKIGQRLQSLCGKYMDKNVIDKKIERNTDLYVVKLPNTDIVRSQFDDDFINTISNWLDTVLLTTKRLSKEYILNVFVNKLGPLCVKRPIMTDELKVEIVDLLNLLPLYVSDYRNKTLHVHKLADSLVGKLYNVPAEQFYKPTVVQPREDDIKHFVTEEIVDILQKYNVKMNSENFNNSINELTDILLDFTEAIDDIALEIEFLFQETFHLKRKFAREATFTVLRHYQEFISFDDALDYTAIEPNTSQSRPEFLVYTSRSKDNTSYRHGADSSVTPVSPKDKKNVVDNYVAKLYGVINKWIGPAPNITTDKREDAVNNLTSMIVNRLKHSERNPNNKSNPKGETEILKDEVSQWINKHFGQEQTKLRERAPELVRQIQNEPVPMDLNKENVVLDEIKDWIEHVPPEAVASKDKLKDISAFKDKVVNKSKSTSRNFEKFVDKEAKSFAKKVYKGPDAKEKSEELSERLRRLNLTGGEGPSSGPSSASGKSKRSKKDEFHTDSNASSNGDKSTVKPNADETSQKSKKSSIVSFGGSNKSRSKNANMPGSRRDSSASSSGGSAASGSFSRKSREGSVGALDRSLFISESPTPSEDRRSSCESNTSKKQKKKNKKRKKDKQGETCSICSGVEATEDPQREKELIRKIEDAIDECVEGMPFDIKNNAKFNRTRYKQVHDLAITIVEDSKKSKADIEKQKETAEQEKIKVEGSRTNVREKKKEDKKNKENPIEAFKKKVKKNINAWIGKLPKSSVIDKKGLEENFGERLANLIFGMNLISGASDHIRSRLTRWLHSTCLYIESDEEKKKEQTEIFNELATKLADMQNSQGERQETTDAAVIAQIVQYLKRLPIGNKHLCCLSDEFIQKIARQLTKFIESPVCIDLPRIGDKILKENIGVWLSKLPFRSGNRGCCKKAADKKNEFIRAITAIKAQRGCSQDIRNVVQDFLKTLPLHSCKANNQKYLQSEIDRFFEYIQLAPYIPMDYNAYCVRNTKSERNSEWQSVTSGSEPCLCCANSKSEKVNCSTETQTTAKKPGRPSSAQTGIAPDCCSDKSNTTLCDLCELEKTLGTSINDMSRDFKKGCPPLCSTANLSAPPGCCGGQNTADVTRNSRKNVSRGSSARRDSGYRAEEHKICQGMEEFLQNWVQRVPIDARALEDKETPDILRRGLYNGIAHEIVKIRSDPQAIRDAFLFQDMLEPKIDSFLDCLPQTCELKSTRHRHKANLMEYVADNNKHLVEIQEAEYYRNMLKDTLSKSLPPEDLPTADKLVLEELAKDDLVDNFIQANYRGNDKYQKLIYKDKVLDCIRKIVEQHAKRAKCQRLNVQQLQHDVYNAMYKVPVPSTEVVKEQVKEIMMRHEISNWYEDLPVAPPKEPNETLQRNKMKSLLALRIIELMNEGGRDEEEKIQDEIQKWLQNIPLRTCPSNIGFYATELTNRMNNNEQLMKTVLEADCEQSCPRGYQSFSRNLPRASTPVRQNDSKRHSKSGRSHCANQSIGPPSLFTDTNTSSIRYPDEEGYETFQRGRPATSSRLDTSYKSSRRGAYCAELVNQQSPFTRQVTPNLEYDNKSSSPEALFNTVSEWCGELPVATEDKTDEEVEFIKINLESRLLIKLGELFTNMEIVNDSYMFDISAEVEIDNILDSLQILEAFKRRRDQLKNELIENLHGIRKQMLKSQSVLVYRKEISDALDSSIKTSSGHREEADDAKEKITDILIELHLTNKARSTLHSEIKKLVGISCEHQQDNVRPENIYSSILSIIPPGPEILTKEASVIKMKEVVKKWLQTIPINEPEVNDSKRTKKLIYVLAKKLVEIEMETPVDSTEYKQRVTTELERWLPKLSITDNVANSIKNFVEDFVKQRTDVKKINDTECVNTYNVASTLQIADNDENKTNPCAPPPETRNIGMVVDSLSRDCFTDPIIFL